MGTRYNGILFGSAKTNYKDFDISFLENPATGDLRVKTDVEAVKQSIRIILFTNFGERPFRPYIAGDLQGLLFEPLDRVTTTLLKQNIVDVLYTYEPRVTIDDISVVGKQHDLTVTIYFKLLNSDNVQKLDVLLHRTR